MSYILEALKKSQAERELGRVPTLDTSVLFEEDKAEPKRGPWVQVAVVLAAAAMLLALYAAFRRPEAQPQGGGASAPTAVPEPGASPVPMPVSERSAPIAGPAGGAVGTIPSVPAVSRPGFAPVPNFPGVPSGAALPPPLPASIPPGAEPPTTPPLVEAPPPKVAARTPVPQPAAVEADPVGAGVDGRGPRTEAELDAELQMELERQLAMESDAVPIPAEPEEPLEPVPTPVPRDLIDQIEAFKDHVRNGPAKTGAPAKRADAAKEDPTTLHLTPAQEAELPAFMLTVHVYVPDKSQRLVLINGLKYREGDTTRENLRVEQILPNGTVLSFQGNPFYVPR